MGQESFNILLIEDNDGDAVLIEKYLERVDEVFLPQEPVLRRVASLSEGFDVLDSDGIDLLLLDLGLPESTGIETLDRVLEKHEDVPVVVLTGLDDRRTAVRAIREGAQDYLDKDRIDAEGFGRALRYAIERKERNEKSERQKRLGRMVQEVLLEASTRREIERRFCEGLVENEPYVYAWIGSPDGDSFVLRAESDGGDGYAEAIEGCSSEDPEISVRAARADEPRFVHGIDDGSRDGWRAEAVERGFASAAAFPLTYNDVSYGVLSVYSDAEGFFDGIEREVLAGIADSVSYSLNTVDKQAAMLSDDATEVRLSMDADVTYLSEVYEAVSGVADGVTVKVRGTVATEDGAVQFVDIEGVSTTDAAEHTILPDTVKGVEVVHDRGSGGRYQFNVSGTTPEEYLTDLGVIVRSTTVSRDGVTVRLSIPPSKNIDEVVKAVEERFGSARVMMCVSEVARTQRRLCFDSDELTEKQSEAIKTAYYRGYFEQPKMNSAEEVADALGVSRSTFLQHLRTAQRKVFAGLFE